MFDSPIRDKLLIKPCANTQRKKRNVSLANNDNSEYSLKDGSNERAKLLPGTTLLHSYGYTNSSKNCKLSPSLFGSVNFLLKLFREYSLTKYGETPS